MLLELEAKQKTMKIGRFCALLAFALFITFDGFAQNAVLNNSYVVHKDWDRQGVNQGMRFHLNLSVNDKKGQDVWCIIEMGYYDGDDIYYISCNIGNYKYNNHLAVSKKLTPTYDNSTWKDLDLFLPYKGFREAFGEKSIFGTITYCVKVIDSNGKVLLQEWQSAKRMRYTQHIAEASVCTVCKGTGNCFNCSGRGELYIGYYNPHYVTCNKCGGKGKCNYCSGSGKRKMGNDWYSSWDYNPNSSEYDAYQDYYEESYSNGGNYTEPESSGKITCPICHGTGKCSTCAGRGEKNYSDGTKYDCWDCHGSGTCSSCGGRGYRWNVP